MNDKEKIIPSSKDGEVIVDKALAYDTETGEAIVVLISVEVIKSQCNKDK